MKKRDGFDQFLIENLKNSDTYIPDDGFAASVMARIPTARKRPRSQEWFITIAPALVMALLLLPLLSPIEAASQLWLWLATGDIVTVFKAGSAVFATTIAACFCWLMRDMRLV